MTERNILKVLLIFSAAAVIYATASSSKAKAISVFNIVKFENGVCNGTNNKYGTCYTEDECEEKGGKASGSCAEGYGVCCTFTLGCGDRSTENCTYFESSKSAAGACNVELCKTNNNVCQIRLDFESFLISPPSDDTTDVIQTVAGIPLLGGAVTSATKGQCLTDSFVVSVPGGLSTPVICGDNKNQHMYIDVPTGCAQMSFHLAATSSVTREWSIKSKQISCASELLAPQGCLQYFYGNGGEGEVKTFNFDGGIHLANQNQNICIRREKNMCRICWSHGESDFQTSFLTEVTMTTMSSTGINGISGQCCGYGTAGTGTLGYDCVVIPGATKLTGTVTPVGELTPGGSEFCGGALATLITAGPAATVCSKVTPFSIRFLSDSFEEAAAESLLPNKGVKLHYKQSCD